ncbi:MAG: ATP-binding protein, partial [Ktedonobacterales bacterium]
SPAALLLTLRDVTEERLERQRAEHRTFSAQLYAERLEAILEQISEAVIICDADGVLLAYNRAALAFARNRRSVERARARGTRLEPRWAILSPEGVPVSEIEQPAFRAMLTGVPMTGGQYVLRGEGKRQTPVLAHAAPLRDESGAITGAVVAFQDITAVKEVERLRDEFLSVASHELRQPLTVIQGQAQMLKRHLRKMASGDARKPLTSEALQAVADGVEAQTIRLNLLVSDLLDMSRIQAGQLKLDPAPTRLVALVKRVVESQRQTTLEHEFRTTVDLFPGENELLGIWDSQRIEQILLNLLSNAVKYSPRGGRVGVRIARAPTGSGGPARQGKPRRVEGPAALVAITDEGIGIPEDALAHLFERFYRARNTGGIQGTGLGLYICRQLAWAHRGDLWVESSGIGSGSTFNLVLPLSQA